MVKVVLSRDAFYNMLRSYGEETYREVMGDLIGIRRNGLYYLVNSCPILNTQRDPWGVVANNCAARRRSVELDRVLGPDRNKDFHVIGQYHAHVIHEKDEEENRVFFGDFDIDAFRDEMKAFQLEQSVQIVLTSRLREYQRDYPPESKVLKYRKSLRTILRKGRNGYDIFLTAFELFPEERPRKLKLILDD